MRLLAIACLLCISSVAFGASDTYLEFPGTVPEIDPGSAGTALALLAGALLLLRSRRSS